MSTSNLHRPTRTMFSELEKFFEPLQSTYSVGKNDIFASDWVPAVDIEDKNDKFIIHADIPGVSAKDIEIHLENNVLTIKGQRESEQKVEKNNYVYTERSKGTFMRRFSLPDTVDADKIEAKSKDGILQITLHKSKESGSRKINVSEG